MDRIFQAVYNILKWISKISGLTYHEVNIIIYYIIIPGFFVFLISRILKSKSLIFGFIVFVLFAIFIIPDFEKFATALFEHSVLFLNWFEYFGLNYVQASVVICVLIPILIIVLLTYLNKKPTN
ncbi:hypothetical protein Celal_3249 [Cellulophaga algicola DSM 14237]|uniref:Transmembrane protein n=1 Tax=Cellulophaga algicola (strain DSM 14237 / IC166 / ACAM 630) TaxID=688270 RepID=E6X5G4_CELAD|nr:hypothetical protein Celal_3249 [Cellulophaga algicola DSM 14237]